MWIPAGSGGVRRTAVGHRTDKIYHPRPHPKSRLSPHRIHTFLHHWLTTEPSHSRATLAGEAQSPGPVNRSNNGQITVIRNACNSSLTQLLPNLPHHQKLQPCQTFQQSTKTSLRRSASLELLKFHLIDPAIAPSTCSLEPHRQEVECSPFHNPSLRPWKHTLIKNWLRALLDLPPLLHQLGSFLSKIGMGVSDHA